MRHWIAAVLFALAVLVSSPSRLGAATPANTAPLPAHRVLLDRYCITCHNQKAKTANLSFDTMDLTHLSKDALVWERAVRKLRGGMMPPPGAPRPDPAAVDGFVSWLEASLDQAAAAAPDPGSVPLHRLNRTEYANAIKDLLGVDADAAAYLPTDDVSNGFDNMANVLKVSPSFLDQYIAAARAMSGQAISNPPPTAPVKAVLRGGASVATDLPLGTRGLMLAEHLFPFDGEYEFKVNNAADSVLTIDGVPVSLKSRIPVKGGMHKVGLATSLHSFAEPEGWLESFVPGNAYPGYGFAPGGAGPGGRRAPGGPTVEVTGPYNPIGKAVETESRRLVFVCRPPAESEESACAARILSNLSHKAFRRPVTDRDLAAPLAFFKDGRATGDFDAAIQSGIIAILSSPKFLYRAEPPPQGLAPGSIYRISDLELASRLSFFLWSTIPDDELLAVAEEGKLKDPKIFEQQVRRMLASPRSRSLVTNFAAEWLKLREITSIDPDPFIYPNFDPSLRTAFRRELELFVDSIQREDRSVLDLLTANYTFVNERLALHYGIPGVRGEEFRRVTLPDSKRDGLFGKGAILLVTSYGNRTSPVLRGAFILENITGTPPSPPPPNVPPFKENKEGEKAHTVREIMEQHRASPTCNACHGVMDPLGFALENFDTIGTWRTKDRFTSTAIDAGGKLSDGTVVGGPDDLRAALMKRPAQFVQTMTEKLLMYSLGRNLSPYDMPTVRKIVRDAARDNYRFSSIVMGIAASAPFQMRKLPETTEHPVEVAAGRP